MRNFGLKGLSFQITKNSQSVVFLVRFSIDELAYFDQYVLSLSLSECYEFNDTCRQEITVLDVLLVPILPCPLQRGYTSSGKSELLRIIHVTLQLKYLVNA